MARPTETRGRTVAIIVAGGQGQRLGGSTPKQFLDLGGRPMLQWCVETFAGHPGIDDLIVVVPATEAQAPPDWLIDLARVVCGGHTRADSVQAGMAANPEEYGITLVHDGARPFVTPDLISRVIDAARSGPAIPVIPVVDTLKRVDDSGWIVETPLRASLRAAQTPQGFPTEVLRRVHRLAKTDAGVTDDALLCEQVEIGVRTVDGEPRNFKVTTPQDLAHARWLLESWLRDDPDHGPWKTVGDAELPWLAAVSWLEPVTPAGSLADGLVREEGSILAEGREWSLRVRGREAIRRAAHTLDRGGVFAHPTATVYGLGGRPRSAVDERIARMKGREPRPLIRLAADIDSLRALLPEAIWTEQAERLAEVFWPGPLTLVLEDGTEHGIAVRVAAHPALRAVLREAGGLMTSTSLNATGQAGSGCGEEVMRVLGQLDVGTGPVGWLDAGDLAPGDPSTLVSTRGGEVRVLREGAVPAASVYDAVAASGEGADSERSEPSAGDSPSRTKGESQA